jgi:hypothetical protein
MKITLEETRLNKVKEELQMRSTILVAARTHLRQLESRMWASQSAFLGRQVPFCQLFATDWDDGAAEMEHRQNQPVFRLAVSQATAASFYSNSTFLPQ